MRLATQEGDFPQAQMSENSEYELHPSHKLILANEGKVMQFRDLPMEAKLAITFYMGVNGEAWDLDQFGVFEYEVAAVAAAPKNRQQEIDYYSQLQIANIAKLMDEIESVFGDSEFGYVNIPTRDLIALWQEIDSDSANTLEFDNFDDYHKWYVSLDELTRPKPTWPVIIGSFSDDLLEDGWHRFHDYIDHRVETIPCLWYPHNGVKVHSH